MTTVSARPDNLAAYQSKLQGMDQNLRSIAGNLLQTLQTYRARCPEYSADHTELAHALGEHAAAMEQLDEWAGRVGEAFRQADRAHGETPAGVACAIVDDLTVVGNCKGAIEEFSAEDKEIFETAHAGWDIFGETPLVILKNKADSALQVLRDWTTKELPEQIDSWWSEVSSLAHDADNGLVDFDDVKAAANSFTRKVDAAMAFTEQWAQATTWAGRVLTFNRIMGGAAIIGDLSTMYDPPDTGVMGGVDRGMALANLGLVAVELLFDLPVIGQVALVATGLYLGGTYLYNNWPWFHNSCDVVGHAVADFVTTAGEKIESEATEVADGVVSAAKTVLNWL
jgi:hypothetical protein